MEQTYLEKSGLYRVHYEDGRLLLVYIQDSCEEENGVDYTIYEDDLSIDVEGNYEATLIDGGIVINDPTSALDTAEAIIMDILNYEPKVNKCPIATIGYISDQMPEDRKTNEFIRSQKVAKTKDEEGR